MEIREYLRIFSRYWWVIVTLAVLGGAIGFATSQLIAPEYRSTATLFVATQNGNTATEAYQNNLFSTERVNSYASLATSEQVAARAVDQLKAPISPEELRGKISAVPGVKTVLLTVSVTDRDPAQAQSYANAVADQLVNLVSELETSRRGGSPAAGAIVVDEAGYPTEPDGLGVPMRVAIGAVAGLVLGIIAAILIGVIDKRLRGRESVAQQTESAVIGALPVSRARAEEPVVDLDNDTAYAERLRELRTNLRFCTTARDGQTPKVIAVTSPTRGDGRTSVALDLAAAFAETGKSVVVVEGDLRNPGAVARLPLTVPMRNAAQTRGLSTFLAGEHGVSDGLIHDVSVGQHRIALLPAGPDAPRPGELWATDRAAELFEELGQSFDYVVVDTPALDDCNEGAVVGALSDGAVLLARIRHTTSTALRRALLALRGANVSVLGAVVTFEPHRGKERAPARGAAGRRAGGTGPVPAPSSDEPDASAVGEGRLVGASGNQASGNQEVPRSHPGTN